ncbi:ATP-binding protein [Candidatus Woesearchaeota archaeon]|nr:ATP-binding protein [Candidatus Woesearchaeota archaeon]
MQIKQILKETPIADEDKHSVIFNLTNKNPDLVSRSFLFYGDPGVGKTYLAENIIKQTKKEIIYMGCRKKGCDSFKEVLEEIDNEKEQLIYLDDVNYLFEKELYGVISEDRKDFLTLLEIIKDSHNKMLILTLNDIYDLDEQMLDRIEIKIKFNLPDEKDKCSYLKKKYKILSNSQVSHIAKNSVGYNYRDLPEMIKLAYRLGKASMTISNIKKAMRMFKPTKFYGFDYCHISDISLKDIIGKQRQKTIVERAISMHNKPSNGIKKTNLMIFSGPPGTGKTFMVNAMAGELGFPLISMGTNELHSPGKIRSVIEFAERYKNCIVFLDEADKLLGNHRFEEDSFMIGEFQRLLEEAQGIEALFILGVNELCRFGNSFIDRFQVVGFDLPTIDERKEYIISKAKDSDSLGKKVDINLVARKTEGMTYRDLERTWNELMFTFMESDQPSVNQVLPKPYTIFG